MKKILFLFLGLTVLINTTKADNDKPIEYSQLPQTAQQFVKKHFSESSIALVKMESDFFDKSYEVIFTDGNKVEFDRSGVWKEIDCRYTKIPNEIVPAQILKQVSTNYPAEKMIQIEKKKRNRYEVKLSNKLELTFDAKFKLIEVDR